MSHCQSMLDKIHKADTKTEVDFMKEFEKIGIPYKKSLKMIEDMENAPKANNKTYTSKGK